MALRAKVYRSHPCLAAIFDLEDPSWDPTVSFGGGHDVSDSYGLPQARPGTKLARWNFTATGHRAGDPTPRSWRSNAWVQLEWARNYAVGRYGSECAALAFHRAHGWW